MYLCKRICAAVIAVLLMAGGTYAEQSISSLSVTAAGTVSSVWNGTANVKWYEDEKTEFHLTSAEQLAGLALLVNSGNTMEGKTIFLDNDIILNDIASFGQWESTAPDHIWTAIKNFSGIFDGQQHTVTGLYSKTSLFGELGENGIIRGLKLNYSYTVSASVCETSSGLIQNCDVMGTVSGKTAGGICHTNSGQLASCTMSGTVTGTEDSAGGICAVNSGTITDCRNMASVSGKSYIGGIAAQISGGNMTECINNGKIQNTGLTKLIYAGGIAGYASEDANISNSANTGAVSGDSVYHVASTAQGTPVSGTAFVYAGGILGYAVSSAVLNNVFNTGTVSGSSDVSAQNLDEYKSSTASSTGLSASGGIAGYAENSVRITDAYNQGSIDSTCKSTASVTNSSALASMKGNAYSGGILGYGKDSAVVTNAYNTGTITCTCNRSKAGIGGIVGSAASPVLINCYYLDASASCGITGADTDTAVSQTESGMQKKSFAEELGKSFSYIADAYPELTWENESESAEETAQQILELTEYSQTATLGIDLGGELTWLSSDTSVATVENGLVTAVGNGSAMIYAVCGDRRAEIPVTVEYDYYFDNTELSIETGTQKQLSFCSVHTKEAYNKLAVWKSSDESIATVDENGIITAVSAGTAEITATAGDVTVTCVITCEESQKESDTAEEQKPEVLKFTEYTETAQLGVNYEGEVVWTSSNPDVATVKDGLVTAVGNGSAVITAVCGEKKAETHVEVNYGYYLKQTEISLISGTQNQLAFTSANNQKVYNNLAVWTSSDESIVKVDESGIITGISEGTAEITATAGDVYSVCTVTVVSPEILVKSTELTEGSSMALSISNYEGSVSWVSSDTKVVTVSGDGTLTAVKAGTATVYAMLENGKTVSVNVTVIPAEEESFLLGDATLDGSVNILDVITINKAILGKEELTPLQVKAADVNYSGVPDSGDALMIMKYIVGLVTKF